jgi:hypothetical protein
MSAKNAGSNCKSLKAALRMVIIPKEYLVHIASMYAAIKI